MLRAPDFFQRLPWRSDDRRQRPGRRRRTACRGASCRPRARQSPLVPVFLSSAQRISIPSERPIQLACIRRTFSGQLTSVSRSPSSSSAYSVILKNHCVSSRLFDECAGAPAAAVDDLLVGEHGVIDGVPVDLRGLAIGEALLQQVEKQLLLVLVVGGRAGRDLAGPIERQAHRFELAAHRVDVGVGPRAGVDLAFHGGVLRRHAEGVPSHWMQDVEALGALVAGKDIAHRVVAHVAHVDAPGGVREHLQDVAFGARLILGGAENLPLFPDVLPISFAVGCVVAFDGHRAGCSLWDLKGARKEPER